MHVECSVDTKHAVKGVGTVLFQLESGGSLKVADVLYVPKLKMNLLSVSALEDKGYAVVFQDGHVLIHSEGATQDAAVKLGVREGLFDRFQGKPVGGGDL